MTYYIIVHNIMEKSPARPEIYFYYISTRLELSVCYRTLYRGHWTVIYLRNAREIIDQHGNTPRL